MKVERGGHGTSRNQDQHASAEEPSGDGVSSWKVQSQCPSVTSVNNKDTGSISENMEAWEQEAGVQYLPTRSPRRNEGRRCRRKSSKMSRSKQDQRAQTCLREGPTGPRVDDDSICGHSPVLIDSWLPAKRYSQGRVVSTCPFAGRASLSPLTGNSEVKLYVQDFTATNDVVRP